MPAVQERSCSGCRFLLGICSTVVSGFLMSWIWLLALPHGPNTATGAHVVPPTGARRNRLGPYNCTMEGSRKPSPQVLRSVRLSSNGCQRSPNLGTAALVSLLNHSSYRTPAEISSE